MRLTLGCLLADQPHIELRRVGSGKRMILGHGEAALSEWMGRNAFVAFHVCERSWELEADLLRTVSLPLNLDQNPNHPFHAILTDIRKTAKQKARSLGVLA